MDCLLYKIKIYLLEQKSLVRFLYMWMDFRLGDIAKESFLFFFFSFWGWLDGLKIGSLSLVRYLVFSRFIDTSMELCNNKLESVSEEMDFLVVWEIVFLRVIQFVIIYSYLYILWYKISNYNVKNSFNINKKT